MPKLLPMALAHFSLSATRVHPAMRLWNSIQEAPEQMSALTSMPWGALFTLPLQLTSRLAFPHVISRYNKNSQIFLACRIAWPRILLKRHRNSDSSVWVFLSLQSPCHATHAI